MYAGRRGATAIDVLAMVLHDGDSIDLKIQIMFVEAQRVEAVLPNSQHESWRMRSMDPKKKEGVIPNKIERRGRAEREHEESTNVVAARRRIKDG